MTPSQYRRIPEVVNVVKKDFKQASGKCNTGAIAARDSVTEVLRKAKINKIGVLGAFAMKDIRKVETVFLDESVLSAKLPMWLGFATSAAPLSRRRIRYNCRAVMSTSVV